MGDFRQRVGLIQELRQLAGSKEGVDHRRQRARIDQVNRREHLVVAHVHPFPYGAGHPGQTDAELGVELLAYRAHAAVAEVVDVVYLSALVHEADQVLHNGDDVVLGEHQDFLRRVHAQLAVDLVAAYFPKVVALVRKEQLVDDAPGRFVIRRLCTAQLAIDIVDGLHFGARGVLLQGIVNDGVILLDVLPLQDDCIEA